MAAMSLPTGDDLLLLHNPRCSKSRALRSALEERGAPFTERLYLEDPLSVEELTDLHGRLGGATQSMVRAKEPEYAAAQLGADSSTEDVLEALARFPKLLERPVLVRGDRAAIGRPGPEAALELL